MRRSGLGLGGLIAATLLAGGASDDAAAAGRDLRVDHMASSHGVSFEHAQQVVGGIPVLDAERVRVFGRGARDLVIDRTVDLRGAPPRDPWLSRGGAIAAARRAVGAHRILRTPAAERVIVARRGRGAAAWRVELVVAKPRADFEVIVDDATAAVVDVRDLRHLAEGRGSVYDANPVVENGSLAGLADAGDADSPLLTQLRREAVLPRIDAGQDCLRGRWVRALLVDADVCAPGRDFRHLTRSDDGFEAVMTYFHIDRFRAYVDSLGFRTLLDRPIVAHVNALDEHNGFYSLASRELVFGQGGIDVAEDGDFIVHEYGHALHHAAGAPLIGSAHARAIAEGFADYAAVVSAAVHRPDPRWVPCWAEWAVAESGEACSRRADVALTLPLVGPGTPCNLEPHCAGQVWSSALLSIRDRLGGAVADRIAFQANYGLPTGASFDDAGRMLLAADRALYGGANREVIREELVRRVLLDLDDTPADAPLMTVPGAAVGALDPDLDRHDMHRVPLVAGRGIAVEVVGGPGLELRLLRPGAADVGEPGAVVAGTSPGSPEAGFFHVPTASGAYALAVSATGAATDYRLAVALDSDGDHVPDDGDRCPLAADAGQEDRDGDGAGDACDPYPGDAADDADGDGIGGDADGCPGAFNPRQSDGDRDGRQDACDPFPGDPADDGDRDGVPSPPDSCPTRWNPDQGDWDADGRGDACDRSAAVHLTLTSRRRGAVVLAATVLPTRAAPDRLVLVAERRRCVRRGRCAWLPARRIRGVEAGVGRVVFSFRLARGRWRLRAELADAALRWTASRTVSLRVAR